MRFQVLCVFLLPRNCSLEAITLKWLLQYFIGCITAVASFSIFTASKVNKSVIQNINAHVAVIVVYSCAAEMLTVVWVFFI